MSIEYSLSDSQSIGNSQFQASHSYKLDKNADPELKFISQPKGIALDDENYLVYYSDSTAGQDTRVCDRQWSPD